MYCPEQAETISPLLATQKGSPRIGSGRDSSGTLQFPGEIIKGRAVKVQELIEESESDETREEVPSGPV